MLRVKVGNRDLIKERSIGAWLLLLWLLNDIILSISRYILTQLNIYGFIRNFILLFLTMIPIVIFLVYIKKIGQKNIVFFSEFILLLFYHLFLLIC